MATRAEVLFASVVHDAAPRARVEVLFASVVHDVAARARAELLFASVVHDAPIPGGHTAASGLAVEAYLSEPWEGILAAHGLAVEATEGIDYDVRALNTKASDLIARIQAEQQRIRDIVDAGVIPDNELRNYAAALTGFRLEIAACRADLDAKDVVDALVYPDGADLITLWKWERGLRSSFVRIDGQLRAAQDIVVELIDNRPGRTYATRSGDTLQSLAVRFFGSPEEWRRILAANDGLDAGELPPGTILTIPEGD